MDASESMPPPVSDKEITPQNSPVEKRLAEEEDAHVNIEVTLMDDPDEDEADGEEDNEEELEEDNFDDFEGHPEHEDDSSRHQPSVDDLLAEDDDEDPDCFNDEDVTVTAANVKKNPEFQSLDEKKEMDPADTPDIAKLMMSGEPQEAELETRSCFDTQGFPCVPGVARAPTM